MPVRRLRQSPIGSIGLYLCNATAKDTWCGAWLLSFDCCCSETIECVPQLRSHALSRVHGAYSVPPELIGAF